MIASFALAGVIVLAFIMGGNLAIWHERKQPIDRRLMLVHGVVFFICWLTVIDATR